MSCVFYNVPVDEIWAIRHYVWNNGTSYVFTIFLYMKYEPLGIMYETMVWAVCFTSFLYMKYELLGN